MITEAPGTVRRLKFPAPTYSATPWTRRRQLAIRDEMSVIHEGLARLEALLIRPCSRCLRDFDPQMNNSSLIGTEPAPGVEHGSLTLLHLNPPLPKCAIASALYL